MILCSSNSVLGHFVKKMFIHFACIVKKQNTKRTTANRRMRLINNEKGNEGEGRIRGGTLQVLDASMDLLYSSSTDCCT